MDFVRVVTSLTKQTSLMVRLVSKYKSGDTFDFKNSLFFTIESTWPYKVPVRCMTKSSFSVKTCWSLASYRNEHGVDLITQISQWLNYVKKKYFIFILT